MRLVCGIQEAFHLYRTRKMDVIIMSKTKYIILCADDYGQNQTISDGIIQLAKHARINAISCMVNANGWAAASQELIPLQSSIYLGLHLNFTEGNALSAKWKKHHGCSFPSLQTIIKKASLQQLNSNAIIAEIQAQIDAYTHTMNAYPDFIDGHQHVHQLPMIRDALLKLYEALPQTIFFRKTSNEWRDLVLNGFPKRQIIALLGGLSFSRELRQKNILCNTSFSGIYDFKNSEHYGQYFKQFLLQSRDGGLIMCHPGLPSEDKHDPLYQYREHELNYFMSNQFLNDLSEQSFHLSSKSP